MMTKQKILKGVDEHLTNLYCAKVDVELDDLIPGDYKKEVLIRMTNQYNELVNIRAKLQEILIG